MHFSRLVVVVIVARRSRSRRRDDALFIIVPLQAPARKNSISGDSLDGRMGEETPTVIEIVLLIRSRGANSGELFAGSRSSERRIKGERVISGEWRKLQ